MNFINLTDIRFVFTCETATDAYQHWAYEFSIERFDDKYITNLSHLEVKQLRGNCKRILQATNRMEEV